VGLGARHSARERRSSAYAVVTLDPAWLFLSLIPGGIGFVLFVYGKKQDRWPQLIAGLALMIYPYFTPGVISLLATGVAICTGLWLAIRLGW
jgi:hypothetical protein